MTTDDEIFRQLVRVRFIMMRINGVLASEGRTNHTFKAVEFLVDGEIRRMAPEPEEDEAES